MTNLQKQKNLKYLNYYKDKLDGIFGPNSKNATKAFQKDYGLLVDGIFGKNTEAKSVEVWKNIQTLLNKSTGLKLIIDGLAGNNTINAIKVFQKNNGLTADGIIGSKTLPKLMSNDTMRFICPINYIQITSPYGKRSLGVHYGIDFGHCSKERWDSNLVQNKALPYDGINHIVIASEEGTISSVNYSSSYGYYIKINHGNGKETFYAHLLKDSTKVKVGNKVKQGQTLAKMGSTGNATGVHLHFELRINGEKVNPLPYLNRTNNQAIGNSIIDGDYRISLI